MPDLDDAADELYAVDPSEFVEARKAAVAAAKASGDKALATAIGKLRKPTTVGWLVNLLVREEPDDIADFFDLGDRLREAQRRSASGDLRDLSAARQQSVRSLSRRAVKLAEEHGRSVSEDAAREVGQTLGAALADPDVAERVRAGRVVTAESYSGFGPATLSLAPEPEESDSEDDVEDDVEEFQENTAEDDAALVEAALVEAQEQLDEAREDEESAREAADRAAAEAEKASSRLAEIKERLTQLRKELHDAEAEETEARKEEKSSERESRRLRRVFTDATARTEEARQALDDLKG